MKNLLNAIVPTLILLVFIYAIIKKVNLYDAFSDGIKQAFPLIVSIFPYLTAIFIMTELMQISGLNNAICGLIAPLFKVLGIPEQLIKLVILKPFSGSGSLAVLSEIYATYGADSYVSRCASCIFGSSETIFYISAVYFADCKNKNLKLPILISLIATFISCVFACLICKIM